MQTDSSLVIPLSKVTRRFDLLRLDNKDKKGIKSTKEDDSGREEEAVSYIAAAESMLDSLDEMEKPSFSSSSPPPTDLSQTTDASFEGWTQQLLFPSQQQVKLSYEQYVSEIDKAQAEVDTRCSAATPCS